MPIRKPVTISLSPELLAVAEGLIITTGRYGTMSDVMRSALRGLEERELDFQTYRDSRKAQRDAPSLKSAKA